MAENLVKQHFQATAPAEAWLSDLAYVPTDEGRLYRVGHKERCTWRIVGYAMGERMICNRVTESLWAGCTPRIKAARMARWRSDGCSKRWE